MVLKLLSKLCKKYSTFAVQLYSRVYLCYIYGQFLKYVEKIGTDGSMVRLDNYNNGYPYVGT